MVITLAIANTFVSRLLIDTGSSVDVLMYDAFIEMGLADSQLYPCWDPLTGFGGDVKPMGCIDLSLTAGTPPCHRTMEVRFVVIQASLPYNDIIGRPTICDLDAAIQLSTLTMMFPTRGGIGIIKGDAKMARKAYNRALKDKVVDRATMVLEASHLPPLQVTKPTLPPFEEKDQEEPWGTPTEPTISWALQGNSLHHVSIGSSLSLDEQNSLMEVLQANEEVFAYSAGDMPGIDPAIIQHHLNVSPCARPIRQKLRRFKDDKKEAARQEVEKLMGACRHPILSGTILNGRI
jgi:hypothetical protein